MKSAGTETAFEDAPFCGKRAKRIFNGGRIEGKALCGLAQREGAVGAGEAADEFEDGMRDGLKQRDGKAGRQRDAEGIAIAGRIFGGDQAAFSGNAQFEQAARTDEAGDRFEQSRSATRRAISARERSPRRRQRS